MQIIKYNKLVRDKIPEIIEKSGKESVVETLGSEAYKKCLDEKLCEGLHEYLLSDSVDELSDLIEVVFAILKYKGTDINTFENISK